MPESGRRAESVRVAMLASFPVPGENPAGGPQVAVGRLVQELLKRDVEVIIVAPDPLRTGRGMVELDGGGTLVTVPTSERWNLARSLRPWRRGARNAVERLGADILHGQSLIPGGIAAAGIDGRPRVVTARGNMRADTLARYHGLGAAIRARQRDRLARMAVEHTDVIVGVNPEWAVNLPQRPKRFVYIPNIVDAEFFDRKRTPEPGRVLFAGGTRQIKGWSLLAEAWPRVVESIPDVTLNAVGWPSGEVPSGIPTELRQTVVVDSALSSSELADRMGRAAVLVIPSEFEVSPIVLAEAWAMGLPVVAARVGGVPALATGAAVLVERDVEALCKGLLAALSGGEAIDRLVEEGRRRADAHRAGAVATAHIALYEELRQAGR
jgi:glycosyltransferase involved in cell wall biosynthesis